MKNGKYYVVQALLGLVCVAVLFPKGLIDAWIRETLRDPFVYTIYYLLCGAIWALCMAGCIRLMQRMRPTKPARWSLLLFFGIPPYLLMILFALSYGGVALSGFLAFLWGVVISNIPAFFLLLGGTIASGIYLGCRGPKAKQTTV